jgi:hypothetical protein
MVSLSPASFEAPAKFGVSPAKVFFFFFPSSGETCWLIM